MALVPGRTAPSLLLVQFVDVRRPTSSNDCTNSSEQLERPRSAGRIRPPDVGRASGWKPRPRVNHSASFKRCFGFRRGVRWRRASSARRSPRVLRGCGPRTTTVARLSVLHPQNQQPRNSRGTAPATAQQSLRTAGPPDATVGAKPHRWVDRCLGASAASRVAGRGTVRRARRGVERSSNCTSVNEPVRSDPRAPTEVWHPSRPGSQQPGPATGTGRTPITDTPHRHPTAQRQDQTPRSHPKRHSSCNVTPRQEGSNRRPTVTAYRRPAGIRYGGSSAATPGMSPPTPRCWRSTLRVTSRVRVSSWICSAASRASWV